MTHESVEAGILFLKMLPPDKLVWVTDVYWDGDETSNAEPVSRVVRELEQLTHAIEHLEIEPADEDAENNLMTVTIIFEVDFEDRDQADWGEDEDDESG